MRRIILLSLLATPALADENTDRIDACLAAASDSRDCIGQIVETCVATVPGGDTTLGRSDCIALETSAWDVILNREYKATRDAFAAADASGDLLTPDATRVEALLEAQRAWIAYRDAECALRYTQWGTGSLRVIAAGNCLMEETAERAMELTRMREE